MSGNYLQPPDNNMDYGADEMRADELRRMGVPRMARRGTHYAHGEVRGKGLRDPQMVKGHLTHSKAHSSFVATPATMMSKTERMTRGRKR